MKAADVSAVIVAWNAGSTLATCIDSLRSSAHAARIDLQLVVVDNASTDGSVDDLGREAGDVVIRNPVNGGYGVAAAQGIARASAGWVLLVNPDVAVDEAFFRELHGVAKVAPGEVATLVPEMRFAAEPDRVNCRGLTVDELGIPAEIDAGRHSPPGALPSLPVLGGSSGCCLLRRDAVVELAGPEPAFFAYLEDVDLAIRLQRAGYRAAFVPDAVVRHEGSAATGQYSRVKVYLVARNRRLLFRLHGPHGVRTRLRRVAVEIGHGVWTSLHAGTAPWRGRGEVLRLRSYVRFLRRSHAAFDPQVRDVTLAPRATLRQTLRRKLDIDRSHGSTPS